MSEPFIGEVRLFGFNFAPKDWALCNGQIMEINENMALFSLIGSNFGGDGRNNFALPDFRGRVGLQRYQQYVMGWRGGQEFVQLNSLNLPLHTHAARASTQDSDRNGIKRGVRYFGNTVLGHAYSSASNVVKLSEMSCSDAGGTQSHPNTQPSLVVSFCISLKGIYPSRN